MIADELAAGASPSWSSEYHAAAFGDRAFVPGETPVPVSGRVFDATELQSLVDASLDFWLTTGRFAKQFERRFARVFGLRHAILVNSGSSANLLALTALTSPTLGDRRLRPGDEVITVAAGFPTTVNPILQNGLVPVFLDVDDPDLQRGRLAARGRAGPAHPRRHARPHARQPVRPGPSPCVCRGARPLADRGLLRRGRLDLRRPQRSAPSATWRPSASTRRTTSPWARAAACSPTRRRSRSSSSRSATGAATAGAIRARRTPAASGSTGSSASLPHGYDHKYTYSHIGYNLKVTDMQAAVGVAQLEKLPGFIAARRRNFDRLHAGLRDLEDVLDAARSRRRAASRAGSAFRCWCGRTRRSRGRS